MTVKPPTEDGHHGFVHVTVEDVTVARVPPPEQARADVADRQEHPVILNERTRFGGESGAGIIRNRCAFTPRDMGADWPEAFTYAVVMGWDGDEDSAMDEMAARWDWDEPMVEFLRDAHRRFQQLADRVEIP